MFGLFSIASGIAMYTPEIFNKLTLINDKFEFESKICGIYDHLGSSDDETVRK